MRQALNKTLAVVSGAGATLALAAGSALAVPPSPPALTGTGGVTETMDGVSTGIATLANTGVGIVSAVIVASLLGLAWFMGRRNVRGHG